MMPQRVHVIGVGNGSGGAAVFRALNFELVTGSLAESMFADRAGQFVARHNWALPLTVTGHEIDEFDCHGTSYLVVEEHGRHRASLRLRSAAAGSMVERYFSELWRRASARLTDGAEVTRFCASPDISPDTRLQAVSDLLLGLCRHCQRTGVETVFGVVFPSVARVIRQCGWAPEVIDRMRHPSGSLLLCEWRPSELVAWQIQECREQRENSWRERRVAAQQRLVA